MYLAVGTVGVGSVDEAVRVYLWHEALRGTLGFPWLLATYALDSGCELCLCQQQPLDIEGRKV